MTVRRFMAKRVLVVLAEGFEEIEAVTPIDVLRRAGLEVIIAGVGKREVTGAHGIKIQADAIFEEYQGLPDAIVLPGGLPGANNLKKSAALRDLLKKMKEENRLIGAICASPARVLVPAGVLEGKKATCYPGFEKEFGAQTTFVEDRVVRDGLVITSRAPGSALEFSLELVEQLVGSEEVEKLSKALLVKVQWL